MRKPKLILTLSLLMLCCGISYSQVATIRGSITDTSEKKGLAGAVVMALRQKDSVMVGHTRTDQSGSFLLNNIPAGKLLIIITYPRYADYAGDVEVKDSASKIDLHQIMMILKSALLKTFVVNGNAAIRLKGDTTEFKADSFKVQPNASIEDLLKKLPGIQVDQNGKITAQGQTVQRVLVDGEEFFGDDPTLVTRNLRANIVDKVQVYDKKSDQAAFTGIDDGQKEKTINIKLKDDKKNGYFGRVSAGAATDGYHDSQAMFNKFEKKEKMAFYGIVSNTGTAGLGWSDANTFGGGATASFDANGNLSQGDDISNWNGAYSGQGYPLVQTGGAHYNNKWDNDVQSLNLNYKVLQLFVNGNSTTNAENILPDSTASYYQYTTQKFSNQILRNKLGGIYELQLDSSSSLKLTVDGGMIRKQTISSGTTSSVLVYDSATLNSGTNSLSTMTNTNSLNSDLLWRKKFANKRRTISIDINEKYTGMNSSGYLYSQNSFFAADTLSLYELTDQHKSNTGASLALNSNISYTEPLSLASTLTASYGISLNNSNADNLSFNKSQTGKYDSLDPLYSSNYSFNTTSQTGGLFYSYTKKKWGFYAGTRTGFTDFKQKDLFADTIGKRSFVNWYPRANFHIDFAPQNSLYINYNGTTTQPTFQQIQPIKNNADPLNVVVGNAALKPSFSNAFGLQYYLFHALSGTNLWTSANYSFTENAISSSSYTDSLGRKVSQSVNVSGNYSLSANINYGLKWKKPDLNFNFRLNANQNRNNSIVNGESNATNSENYTFGFYAGKYKENKFDVGVDGSATYTSSTSSIQTGLVTRYWTYEFGPNMDLFLPLKFEVNSQLNWTIREKTVAFPGNNNVALWNAWFGKKLLKGDQLLIKISVNDILDQNKGFNRNVSSNFISQNTYSTIQRYFMLSVVWNFTKMGTTAPPANNGIFISN
jgi:Outer membrane protein beta-barrel family/Carboxypeptidase regulatory-like domain